MIDKLTIEDLNRVFGCYDRRESRSQQLEVSRRPKKHREPPAPRKPPASPPMAAPARVPTTGTADPIIAPDAAPLPAPAALNCAIFAS